MSVVATCKAAFKMGDAQEGSFPDKNIVNFSNSLIYIVSPTEILSWIFSPLMKKQISYRQMKLSLINDSWLNKTFHP